MAVAGLSFEELEFSSPSLLLLPLLLAAFWFFLSPVLLDFSLLVLFLPAICAQLLLNGFVEFVWSIYYDDDVLGFRMETVMGLRAYLLDDS